MADTGLGDILYLGGNDLSGDVSTVTVSGGPTLDDVTNLTQNAYSRVGTALSGLIDFTAFFNGSGEHPVLKTLPTTDVIGTYVHGSGAFAPAAGLQARQPDYKPTRGTDGSLTFAVELQSDAAPLEWGKGYVGGASRTDTGPTTGASVDDGNPTASGLSAYLHVFALTGTSATVLIEHSADNGVSDPWTTAVGFVAVSSTPTAQRVTTTASPIKRWLRVRTTGTFSNLRFYTMASRLAGLIYGVVGVAVDVQIFTSSGTWTKPGGVTATYVGAVGGGGGGGSGACQAVSCAGGAGGGGGAFTANIFASSTLGATETVTVGAGGAGGSPVGISPTNGQSGHVGGNSIFGTTPKLISVGGLQGLGGNTAGGVAGGQGAAGQNPGSAGGSAQVAGFGLAGTTNNTVGAAGGGGGGGPNVGAGTDFSGGIGGQCAMLNFTGAGTGGGPGTNGGNATGATVNTAIGGQGGGGGGSDASGFTAGNGGAGGIYGGGGGGGGGIAANTFGQSGAGGAGASGIVVVISW